MGKKKRLIAVSLGRLPKGIEFKPIAEVLKKWEPSLRGIELGSEEIWPAIASHLEAEKKYADFVIAVGREPSSIIDVRKIAWVGLYPERLRCVEGNCSDRIRVCMYLPAQQSLLSRVGSRGVDVEQFCDDLLNHWVGHRFAELIVAERKEPKLTLSTPSGERMNIGWVVVVSDRPAADGRSDGACTADAARWAITARGLMSAKPGKSPAPMVKTRPAMSRAAGSPQAEAGTATQGKATTKCKKQPKRSDITQSTRRARPRAASNVPASARVSQYRYSGPLAAGGGGSSTATGAGTSRPKKSVSRGRSNRRVADSLPAPDPFADQEIQSVPPVGSPEREHVVIDFSEEWKLDALGRLYRPEDRKRR